MPTIAAWSVYSEFLALVLCGYLATCHMPKHRANLDYFPREEIISDQIGKMNYRGFKHEVQHSLKIHETPYVAF